MTQRTIRKFLTFCKSHTDNGVMSVTRSSLRAYSRDWTRLFDKFHFIGFGFLDTDLYNINENNNN